MLVEVFGQVRAIRSFLFPTWALVDPKDCSELLSAVDEGLHQDQTSQKIHISDFCSPMIFRF